MQFVQRLIRLNFCVLLLVNTYLIHIMFTSLFVQNLQNSIIYNTSNKFGGQSHTYSKVAVVVQKSILISQPFNGFFEQAYIVFQWLTHLKHCEFEKGCPCTYHQIVKLSCCSYQKTGDNLSFITVCVFLLLEFCHNLIFHNFQIYHIWIFFSEFEFLNFLVVYSFISAMIYFFNQF